MADRIQARAVPRVARWAGSDSRRGRQTDVSVLRARGWTGRRGDVNFRRRLRAGGLFVGFSNDCRFVVPVLVLFVFFVSLCTFREDGSYRATHSAINYVRHVRALLERRSYLSYSIPP
jgi:hypothetical protein